MQIKPSSIGIIPARSGSKRVPGKNIRPFAGKPLIAYPIESMLRSGIFDRIIVSTDSPEIAEIARACGAETPFLRCKELANDETATIDVVIDTIQQLRLPDSVGVCCAYATNPFLTPELLEATYSVYVKSSDVDYVTVVSKYSFPPQRSLEVIDGCLKMRFSEFTYTHSQNLQPMYHETAQLWWGQTETWLARISMQNRLKAILLPEWAHQDIDTPDDWITAELKFASLSQRNDWPIPYDDLIRSVLG